MPTILPIPAFDDNYFWLIHNNTKAWVVDPGDAQPVIDKVSELSLQLEGVLITHHHPDHTGGIEALCGWKDNLTVYGPASSKIKVKRNFVNEPNKINILGLDFKVIDLPGHTLDHIAYYSADTDTPSLFCGDTLFAGGCGRLFEGTAQQMHASLGKLAVLPATTHIYCAHEYTLANLKFANMAEPDNPALEQRIAVEQAKRANNQPTLPSSIGLELATNPFLRVDQPKIIADMLAKGAKSKAPADIFATLRGWKDTA